eukprot:TRINITY_DN24999_c0_g1_i3.p1 TRINITY_DN24999_c0_g1~~TRINITY_DN24999_c0_g1_i3.p1  ORF type:complete len:352 (+),score=51.83 TRINITY_DN24999_c0_g1_i3:79-1056(+)
MEVPSAAKRFAGGRRDPCNAVLLWAPGDAIADEKSITAVAAATQVLGSATAVTVLPAGTPSAPGNWRVAVVLATATDCYTDACLKALRELRRQSRTTFLVMFAPLLIHDPVFRIYAFLAGARMVTSHSSELEEALRRLARSESNVGPFACPQCGLPGLTEDGLHLHHHLYHTVDPNDEYDCPICGCEEPRPNFAVHLHNLHGPPAEREPAHAPYTAFVWVVARRHDGKFLMVNEPAGISGGIPGYWLPAGRVDSGESLAAAAVRETLEEGGVEVRITGVLRFMLKGRSRPLPRIVFMAEPVDEMATVAKTVPDWDPLLFVENTFL